jgi:hypothetical protein
MTLDTLARMAERAPSQAGAQPSFSTVRVLLAPLSRAVRIVLAIARAALSARARG